MTDHCQLVEQFENLLVVVMQLWEMNNALRESANLPRQPLPIAGSLACTALRTARSAQLSAWRTGALPACEQTGVRTEQETPSEGYDGLVPASSFSILRSTSSLRGATMPVPPAAGQ